MGGGSASVWLRPRRIAVVLGLGVAGLLAAGVAWEWHSSTLQAKLLSAWAGELSFDLREGPASGNRYPQAGPFDLRMGYTRIPQFALRLSERDYQVAEQAQQSAAMIRYGERGFFPPYHEKTQTGLVVRDCRAAPLFSTQFPLRAYPGYEDIPPLLAETLAFIENRELLTATAPRHNPALEWPRLGRALLDQAISMIDRDHPAAGGSTLATQLEKFRHSPEGRTASVGEKYRQLVSASVRAYLDGEYTEPARRRILLNYLNSLPLGAQRGHGEVIGILDGLRAWYGTDAVGANELLRASANGGPQQAEQARVYRQVVSLLIAQRRPSYYLGAGQGQLAAATDSYLRLLAEAGVIAAPLRDAALQARLSVRESYVAGAAGTEVNDLKAATLARVQLAALLDTSRLYDLDHLDLAVDSTIDGALQKAVTETLRGLRDPERAREAGLIGFQLLERGDPSQLVYSFTLYERGEGVNRVRVQTDNQDQPFDINTGAKLELGSTAKLRALTSYLETVAALHAQLSPLDRQALRAREVAQRDRLTRWAVDHLLAARDRSLPAMLQAAMERRYSASPHESFFTGGGVHSFSNFDRRDDGRIMTVAEAFRGSVNLVFIRLMRDIVQHHMYRGPRAAEQILKDPGHPERVQLLGRFADREGSRFLRGFLAKYQGHAPQQMLEQLVKGLAKPTPVRLAVVYRSWAPEAPFEAFSAFMREHLPADLPRGGEDELRQLYERYAPGRFSLSDRGYLARVHPLELWLLGHLRQHPLATQSQVIAASAEQRQEVYGWLLRSRFKQAQDSRIVQLIEADAFAEIHRSWQRLGFPFDSLVPSYATAIGSSGDRPAALAELVGIIVNDGVRQPAVQLETLHFAADTPYETLLRRRPGEGERVLAPEVTQTLRRAMMDVVEQGTARRLRGVLLGPDGRPLVVGGKTGTGDNRLQAYGPRGVLIGSRVVNRTATFVFFIGDRHFGILTAYVPGLAAEGYRFTSALPVTIVKALAPLLTPALAPAAEAGCAAARRVAMPQLEREARQEAAR
ncbi:transglycosylase domain-containing protein [Ramlibacter sp. 2FC]|uniref:transglycosylase domain-containing protein n=1 Tax=Ramlibacter sp. 2FC TaxID=2502188 RepID=UPI0010F8218A|nr:transglycosylase domain-containing protein [Ramlibacter sp. 2FC]